MNQENNCEQIKPVLLDFLMEEVPADRRRAIETHVQSCVACSKEMADLKETLSLVERAEVSEEIPRRIRIVAEPERPWVAFWRNPARLALAGGATFCFAIALLALFHTTISYRNGNFQLAFGAPAVSSGAPLPVTMPASAAASLDQAQVNQMISKALAAAEQEHDRQSGAMAQQVSERMQQQWRRDLGEMAQSMRYFQEAQTVLWKGQVQNQQLVSTLMEQSRPPVPQQQ